MHVLVVGAGVGGLATALAWARSGHEVTVLERDATPLPSSAEAAFAWDRRGAPQVRHSHAFLARLRNLMRDRFPDVLEDLLAAGASELRFAEMLPDTVTDRSARPGDDDLVALACRRTTFEWILRRAVSVEPEVRLLDGVTVHGLICDAVGAVAGVPVCVGVRSGRGGTVSTIGGDVVVVAGGRRSPLADWLAQHGVRLTEQVEDTGIVYFSRFYRLRDPTVTPPRSGPIGGDLGYCKYAVFDGDNGTFSVTLACAVEDRELRTLFGDADGFGRTAAALTATAPWVAEDMAAPFTEVYLMAGLLNRSRRFVDDAEAPIVLGLHAVGDAHTCTNPLYGRGCSLAMVQAVGLTDALAAQPDDPAARSVAYEAACEREILPWYRAAVAQDGFSRSDANVVAPGGEVAAMTGDQVRALLRDGLMPAVRTDPDVFRAFVRSFNLLDPPEALMADPHVVQQVLAAYQTRDERPAPPALGPERDALLVT